MSQINVGTVNASVGINLPNYTVAQRPSPSTPGQQIYDPDDGFIYVADGAQWVKVGGGRAANGLSSDTAATSLAEITNAGATADGGYIGFKMHQVELSIKHMRNLVVLLMETLGF